eukprot:gene11292-18928_t
MSNGHIHVWELHLKRPPSFTEAWTHLAKERIDVQGCDAMPNMVSSMSLAQDRRAGTVHDHVFMGTASGDCLVCNVSHGGSLIFRFPAFKHQPLQCISLDIEREALMTSSKASLKIWNLRDMKCMHTLSTTLPISKMNVLEGQAGVSTASGSIHLVDIESRITISKMDVLEGQAVVGTASGSIHLVDIESGNTVPSSSAYDHMDVVTGVGTSDYLQHFVTCSRDSHLKIFDQVKTLKRSVDLAASIL